MNLGKSLLLAIVSLSALTALAQIDQNPVMRFKGKPLPKISMVTTKGVPISNRTFRGKVVLIDFWASWCGPCLRLSKVLEQVHEKYAKKGVLVIGADLGENAPTDLAKSLRTHPKAYTVTVKNDQLGESMGVVGYPTVLVVDRKGIVREVMMGYSDTIGDQYNKLIDKLVAEK